MAPALLDDCRDLPGGACGAGVCAPPAPLEDADGAWACRCDKGWTRLPAHGTAGMCTVNPSLSLAFCAVSTACAVSLLAGTAAALRGGTAQRWSMLPLIVACLLCLVADTKQVLEPTSVMWADAFWSTLLKMVSGFLINDVVVRFTFLRYRTYLLAKARIGTSQAAHLVKQTDVELALLRRTFLEIAAAFCVFVAAFCLAFSSSSTRVTGSIVFAYWALAPAVVAKFIVHTTRSLLDTLADISDNQSGEFSKSLSRVHLAKAKAATVRNITVTVYAVICISSLGLLALLPYTAQYVHLHTDTIYVAAMGGCAINQRAQSRIRRRHLLASHATTMKSVHVAPSPEPGGAALPSTTSILAGE